MTQQRNFWMRWRVRVGYPIGVIYWLLAAPTTSSIVAGSVVAAVGLIVRGASSGHLRKYEELCTTGPYAHTRNPLYFGSALLAGGFIVAGRSWWTGIIVAAYFGAFYYAVMRNEESDLRARYGRAFEEYAASVPLFWPRTRGAYLKTGGSVQEAGGRSFSWSQYARNREYQALIGTLAGIASVWFRMWVRTHFRH